jgi:two-component system, OmpR family, sensor histidine kinase PhoQ
MSSLSARLLVSVSVLLLVFFGATIVVLDTAFVSAGEHAREEILDGYLMQLLADAEPVNGDHLGLPADLVETRFNAIGSGLYAELEGDAGERVWQSRSALGLELPGGPLPAPGEQAFSRSELPDGTPLLVLSLAVQWEFADGQLTPYVFRVYESLDAFNAQVAGFRRQLFGWFGAVAAIMLLAIGLLMRRLLSPLRRIEGEIAEIEEGSRPQLSESYPTELASVARNMNLLIDSERARSDRYRYTLDNLAHSLKTPLAAVHTLLDESADPVLRERLVEQVERMDEIVRYQLRKPAAGSQVGLAPVPVAREIERLVGGLQKVYRDKAPDFDIRIAPGMQFRGDTGDFLELAGNLLDNACKWCRQRVKLSIDPAGSGHPRSSGMRLLVEDDGPGIPESAAEALLARGVRLDESAPGHGIGLAIVKDIARSYGGELSIGTSPLGGAGISVVIPPLSVAAAP